MSSFAASNGSYSSGQGISSDFNAARNEEFQQNVGAFLQGMALGFITVIAIAEVVIALVAAAGYYSQYLPQFLRSFDQYRSALSAEMAAMEEASTLSIAEMGASTPRLLESPSAQRIFEQMGSFEGQSIHQVNRTLRQNGFRLHGQTEGGYIQYRGLDNSRLWIRDTGEVLRLQKVPSQKWPLRFDQFGDIGVHPMGEFLRPWVGK